MSAALLGKRSVGGIQDWQKRSALSDKQNFGRLLETALPLVRPIVRRIKRRLSRNFDADELEDVAVSGLLAAARDYRALQDGSFRVYAVKRIRGAIFEELQGKKMSATDIKKATAATIDEVFHEAMRCYEKHMEEFVETFNRTSNQTIDLFEKTLGVYQATSVPDAQRRVQDLIEGSLSTLRVNVHSALNTNTKIIASWKELVDRFGPAVK
jgi:DNA-directed RNA polymerase specialized sigma subunit